MFQPFPLTLLGEQRGSLHKSIFQVSALALCEVPGPLGLPHCILHLILRVWFLVFFLFFFVFQSQSPSFVAFASALFQGLATSFGAPFASPLIITHSLHLAVAAAFPHIPKFFIIILIWDIFLPLFQGLDLGGFPDLFFIFSITVFPDPCFFLHCLARIRPLSRWASNSSSDHCSRIVFRDTHLSF